MATTPYTLFISDLHLEEGRPDITALFLDFLAGEARKADALYILGDLFEVWIGDDNRSDLNQQVASALRALVTAGTPVFFIHGNRDFLLGQHFAKAAGMVLLPEVCLRNLYGTPTLLMHGDTLCTLDLAYQAFRKKSRNIWWQRPRLALPLWLRRRVAANMRRKGQRATAVKSAAIMDVTPDEVVRVMEHFQTLRLIHGHTHRPAIHDVALNTATSAESRGQRIVLGDWYTQGSVLVVTPEGCDLQKRPLPSEQTGVPQTETRAESVASAGTPL